MKKREKIKQKLLAFLTFLVGIFVPEMPKKTDKIVSISRNQTSRPAQEAAPAKDKEDSAEMSENQEDTQEEHRRRFLIRFRRPFVFRRRKADRQPLRKRLPLLFRRKERKRREKKDRRFALGSVFGFRRIFRRRKSAVA